MVVSTCRFTQYAAVVCKIDVSCITMQQIVYEQVDVPPSARSFGILSLSHSLSLANTLQLTHWASGRRVCIYTYLGGRLLIWERWAPLLSPGGAGEIGGGGGVSSGVGSLHLPSRGVPVLWHLLRICGCVAHPFWQDLQPSIGISWTIAGCLSIAVFTCLCTGNSTPRSLSSPTLASGCIISFCISSIAACENPPLAILAISKASHRSDCSSCTRPPYLAIVADKFKTYKKLVAVLKNVFWLLPLPYLLA